MGKQHIAWAWHYLERWEGERRNKIQTGQTLEKEESPLVETDNTITLYWTSRVPESCPTLFHNPAAPFQTQIRLSKSRHKGKDIRLGITCHFTLEILQEQRQQTAAISLLMSGCTHNERLSAAWRKPQSNLLSFYCHSATWCCFSNLPPQIHTLNHTSVQKCMFPAHRLCKPTPTTEKLKST